jgi:hypothetical protein
MKKDDKKQNIIVCPMCKETNVNRNMHVVDGIFECDCGHTYKLIPAATMPSYHATPPPPPRKNTTFFKNCSKIGDKTIKCPGCDRPWDIASMLFIDSPTGKILRCNCGHVIIKEPDQLTETACPGCRTNFMSYDPNRNIHVCKRCDRLEYPGIPPFVKGDENIKKENKKHCVPGSPCSCSTNVIVSSSTEETPTQSNASVHELIRIELFNCNTSISTIVNLIPDDIIISKLSKKHLIEYVKKGEGLTNLKDDFAKNTSMDKIVKIAKDYVKKYKGMCHRQKEVFDPVKDKTGLSMNLGVIHGPAPALNVVIPRPVPNQEPSICHQHTGKVIFPKVGFPITFEDIKNTIPNFNNITCDVAMYFITFVDRKLLKDVVDMWFRESDSRFIVGSELYDVIKSISNCVEAQVDLSILKRVRDNLCNTLKDCVDNNISIITKK